MKKLDKCFISYCHSDVDKDILNCLIQWLEEISNNNIEILIDHNLNPGDSLNEFMDNLLSINAIIIIMTPNYKKKISNREGGVYREYKIIYDRYLKEEERKRAQNSRTLSNDRHKKLTLLPILFSGTEKTAAIPELKDLLYSDFVGLHICADSKNNHCISDSIKKRYKRQMVKIVNEITANENLNTDNYHKLYDELYDGLFIDLKADWNKFQTNKKDGLFENKIFVKTKPYSKISKQNVFLLVGRKGSGKSTVATFIAHKDTSNYKGVISIEANDINLEIVFGFFTDRKLSSDITSITSLLDTFQHVWELFLYLKSMEILIKEYNKNSLTREQLDSIAYIKKFINKLNNDNDSLENKSSTGHYFTFALESIKSYIENSIDNARDESGYYHSDMIGALTFDKIIKNVLGIEVCDAFTRIVQDCNKHILITLDNFDTAFEEFRKTSTHYYKNNDKLLSQQRSNIETQWLRSLLTLAFKIKKDHSQKNPFYKIIDFCITVPKDRFIDIQSIDRDSYLYNNNYSELNWTGIELLILLQKRFETLTDSYIEKKDYTIEKEATPTEKFDKIMSTYFPYIPTHVETAINGKKYKLPLFLYVLRHTFWRPRDILYFYANIIAMSKELHKRHLKVSNIAIRRSIKDANFDVVNSEFINEFKYLIVNLDEILNIFKKSEQVISFSKLEAKLSRINFNVVYSCNPITKFSEKIKMLYEIGFLGIYADKKMMNLYGLRHKHAFFFNEGFTPLKGADESMLQTCSFIIHPIFIEYLNLSFFKKELILEFDWDYLYDHDAHA